MPRIVFVQRDVSQLDEPVYAKIHELDPQACSVIYWNDYGYTRKHLDPELGLVPDLIDGAGTGYPRSWLDSRLHSLTAVIRAVALQAPRIVVVSDIPQSDRLRMALRLRIRGISTALRTDKNALSERVHAGWKLAAERHLTRLAYTILAPTSPLTSAYYDWPPSRPSVPFPYTTNAEKFAPPPAERSQHRHDIRGHLGIDQSAHVFLSAAKFVARENPWALIRSFETVAVERAHACLIALGDGPQLPEIKNYCAARGLDRVIFPGFVPFRELQNYFFAADTFLHFAEREPWGVSPQDALIAGLGLVTSNRVGAGLVFLEGVLARFVVPLADQAAAVERMIELCDNPASAALFTAARAKAEGYTVVSCAGRWAGLGI
jgi:glycosyltransferase involved in cell wall biosynthesis